MKTKLSLITVIVLSSILTAPAQKAQAKAAAPRSIIFAVVDDGKRVEPIAYLQQGKLVESAGGDDTESVQTSFATAYYKPKVPYSIIFGGAADGRLLITKRSDGECSGNSAEVTASPVKGVLKGFVMALATNAPVKAPKGVRLRPTAAERTEIEALVRAEFAKQNTPAESLKTLRYHNLTGLDIDGDGKAELVGSYWVAPKADERRLLFFIAEKAASGKYQITHGEYNAFTPDNVMSGELKDLDDGIYHTLLLDVFDYDSNGTAEIFTTSQAFEGRNFAVYRREAGKWSKAFESYNYRCGY
jgi:hypothetical protein